MGRNSAHILVACVAALVGLGLTMLASVGAFSPDNRGQTLYFLQRQGLWLAVGTGICVGLSRCDAKSLLRFAGWIFGLATLLVAISLVPGLGKSVKGSARWIPLGPFAVQPGEMLKLATVLLAAAWVKWKGPKMKLAWDGLILPFLILLLPVLLLVKQPDLGSAAFVMAAAAVVLFVGGAPIFPLLMIGVLGLIGVGLVAVSMP
jgi:cell division protein FtsW